MKKKLTLILDDEFIQYCELNNILDIEKLAKETFNRGFTILKHGETPRQLSKPTPNPRQIPHVPIERLESLIETSLLPKENKDLYGE